MMHKLTFKALFIKTADDTSRHYHDFILMIIYNMFFVQKTIDLDLTNTPEFVCFLQKKKKKKKNKIKNTVHSRYLDLAYLK